MKKIFNFISLFLVFIAVIFFGCNKEASFAIAGDNLTSLTLNEAKAMYETEISKRSNSLEKGGAFKNKDFDKTNVVPLWDAAKSHWYNGQSYIEVPFSLKNDRKFSFSLKSKDEVKANSLISKEQSEGLFRLIFEKKKDNSKFAYFFLAYGDSLNVAKSGKNPVINIFGDKTDFTGIEQFHYLNGELSHGFQHRTSEDLKNATKSQLEERYVVEICDYWVFYSTDASGNQVFMYSEITCHYVNREGGTGSSGTVTGTTSYSPCAACGNGNPNPGGGSSTGTGSTGGDSPEGGEDPKKFVCRCKNSSKDLWMTTQEFNLAYGFWCKIEPYVELTQVECKKGTYTKNLHYVTTNFTLGSFDATNDNVSEWDKRPMNPSKQNCGWNVTLHGYGTLTFHATTGALEEITKSASWDSWVNTNLD